MSYQVIIPKKVLKELSGLPLNYGKKVAQALVELENDPRPVGSKKLKGSENKYRIRVGDYRVIYTIEDNILIIEVIRIAHRREVYD
jgi:mRNA interferase RelE/StbE